VANAAVSRSRKSAIRAEGRERWGQARSVPERTALRCRGVRGELGNGFAESGQAHVTTFRLAVLGAPVLDGNRGGRGDQEKGHQTNHECHLHASSLAAN